MPIIWIYTRLLKVFTPPPPAQKTPKWWIKWAARIDAKVSTVNYRVDWRGGKIKEIVIKPKAGPGCQNEDISDASGCTLSKLPKLTVGRDKVGLIRI